MKKKMPPRLTLKRETIRQLEQPTLLWVVAGRSSVAGGDPCGTNTGTCPPKP